MTARTVRVGEREIEYRLERKAVKNLNLRIRKDGGVFVSASVDVPLEEIDGFVRGKANYIFRAVDTFGDNARYSPGPKRYVSGESFCILGRNARLKVSAAEKDSVEFDGVYILLNLKNPEDAERRRRMIDRFFDGQCERLFGEIVREVYPKFGKYGVDMPRLRIRDMETRWGSCLAKKGIITLNKKLLSVPRNCIEYVVTHEFCHFIHSNHSKSFYALLTVLMPDWRERKNVLEKYGIYGV